MKVFNHDQPVTVNPFTNMMGKPCEKYTYDCSETEDETTDHSEDPLSCSDSSSFCSWDAALDVPSIDSSFQEMAVDVVPESDASLPKLRSCLKGKEGKLRASIQFTGEVDLNLPMHGMPVRKRTCVSFKNSVRVRHVIPALQLANHQKECLWFQASEYSKIEKRCHLIAHKVLRGEDHNGRTLCFRGLESLLCPRRRRGSKVEGWITVFSEQVLQRQEGQYDEDKMRIMYRTSSLESSIEAQNRGIEDEEDVQKYLFATRAMCNKFEVVKQVRCRVL